MSKQVEDIKTIREMMEKSSKFQSLNGLSLVIAGVIALAGAIYAYFYIQANRLTDYEKTTEELLLQQTEETKMLLVVAVIVLFCAVAVTTLFICRKTRKNSQQLLAPTTLRAVYNLMIPLAAGGIFSLISLLKGNVEIAIASTLVFYGLGLINASKYTFSEIHFLGIAQLILGLVATCLPQFGIELWALGFGVFNIVFGIIMYIKYDWKKR